MGRPANSSVVAAATLRTASSKGSAVLSDVDCTPLTLRTYWRAAASISSGVASGSSPRSVVMFLHTSPPQEARRRREAVADLIACSSSSRLILDRPGRSSSVALS